MNIKQTKIMLSIIFGILGAFLIGLGIDILIFTLITIGFVLLIIAICFACSIGDDWY